MGTLDYLVVEHQLPRFVKACESHDDIVMTRSAFAGEPELLEIALRYASDKGVTVYFAPEATEGKS